MKTRENSPKKFKEDKKNPSKNIGEQMKRIFGGNKKPHNDIKKPKKEKSKNN